MMKKALYFTLKALFILEIFQFLFWNICHLGKRLDKKAKVNFNICDVTNCITNNCTYFQISGNKGNQKKKFGQLIEYIMRNIFHEKLCTKCGGEISPRLILKNWNWADFWINSLKFYSFVFIACPSRGLPKRIKTKVLTTCF